MIKRDVVVTVSTPPQLSAMKAEASAMLTRAIHAYTHGDVDAARETVLQDDEVDTLKKELFDTTIQAIKGDALSVDEGTYILWVGHKLERFADRTVTISKRAAYVELGHTPYFEAGTGSQGSVK
jgi:phosphate uptake regulator